MIQQHRALYLDLSKKRHRTLVDRSVNVAALAYPLMGVPEVLLVFGGGSADVSIISWAGFACFSFLFLLYGLLHHLRPVIIANALWLIVDILVVVGVAMNRMVS